MKELDPAEVTQRYCDWLNDPQVNQFLESRFQIATLDTVRAFVRAMLKDPANILFAIRLQESGRHIGNIKLGPIDRQQRRAEVGLVVGEEDCRGKGYASEALALVVDYAFAELGLHKLTAGCYEPNTASVALFTGCGFAVDGIRKRHCWYQGTYVDAVLFGLFNPREEEG